jgi:zinc finger CCHC domain-containing protein 9
VKNSAGESNGKSTVVGICYRYVFHLVPLVHYSTYTTFRCGSRRHTLSRCKKPVDASNPLPFASCFVCSGKGHLASSCPQNKSKGIYPNGGCCKLCGDTTHLARNCELQKQGLHLIWEIKLEALNYFCLDTNNSVTILGIASREATGADEDDFHVLKRRKDEMERDEKTAEKIKRSLGAKAGTAKKVVYF